MLSLKKITVAVKKITATVKILDYRSFSVAGQ